jgi:hypothetical protein
VSTAIEPAVQAHAHTEFVAGCPVCTGILSRAVGHKSYLCLAEIKRAQAGKPPVCVCDGIEPLERICKHCKRPIYRHGDDWRLVYVEYERTHLCDARGMDHGHEPAERVLT